MAKVMTQGRSNFITLHFRSRTLRTVHYEIATRKLVVITAHRKTFVYSDISPDLVASWIAKPASGWTYNAHLRLALRPYLSRMSISNALLLRRIKKIVMSRPSDHGLVYT